MFSRGLSVIMYRQNRTRDVALAFGVLWYLGYCEYPTIGRFGGPKTDLPKTWYPGPQTVPRLLAPRAGHHDSDVQVRARVPVTVGTVLAAPPGAVL